MTADRIVVRTNKGPLEYTCLGCPLTRNRTAWCFRLCEPDDEGNGRCGRLAPHGLRSKTQLSIERHGQQRLAAHCEKLERMYLAAPCNEYYDPGVRISEGEAEIMIPIQQKFLRVASEVHASVCFTALADAAVLAVNSMVEKVLVLSDHFEIHLHRRIATGQLIARSRYLGMSGNDYLAESVLTESDGYELGNGRGTFQESDIRLSTEIGYE